MNFAPIDYVPLLAVLVAAAIVWMAARAIIRRDARNKPGVNVEIRFQVVTIVVVFAALVAGVVALPISEARSGQILALLGIVLSAAIALSATTILGNLIAGMMLRSVRGFGPGDFIRVEGHFGRVSSQGLFHTEIQTEDRDLTTLPNGFLAAHPFSTIRNSGTVVSTTVGLGYDVPRHEVEIVLLAAAEEAGLEQAFVQIVELGDFAVVYRCAGLLTDVLRLITVKSNLNAAVLDGCHAADIEIVSPSFMNQRQVNDQTFIPKGQRRRSASIENDPKNVPELMLFDKAEKAASRQILLASLAKIEQIISEDGATQALEYRRDVIRDLIADLDHEVEAGE
ncbi:MAG: mechanosensitive ion channel family protein [Actinomycetota bacterium]